MKKSTLTYLFIFMTTALFGQEFKISVGPTLSNISYYKLAPGLYSRAKFGLNADFEYIFITNRKLEFGIGATLHNSHVEIIIPHLETLGATHITQNVALLSINFTSIYNLGPDFYLRLSPILDFQIKHNPLHRIGDQTGVGLSFGIGNNIKLSESVSLNIEPKLWIHNMIPLRDKHLNYWLTTAGLNMGLVFGHKKNLND